MLIVERRTLGVFAALGAALSLVVVLDSLPDPPDPAPDSVMSMTSGERPHSSPAVAAAFNPPQSGRSRPEGSGGVLPLPAR
jgi:hypothetical protein